MSFWFHFSFDLSGHSRMDDLKMGAYPEKY